MILDGKKLAADIRKSVSETIKAYTGEGKRAPTLVIITVGHDEASKIYVRNKIRACEEVGIQCYHVVMADTATQTELDTEIEKYGEKWDVDGIIVQLPLPNGLNARAMEHHPSKDVDGFTAVNLGSVLRGEYAQCYVPATPLGIITILNTYGIDTVGKNVTVLGRSNIVGKPIAAILMNKPYSANVTVLHSQTPEDEKKRILANSDIVISAVGKPDSIPSLKTGATIIDVGINRTENGIVGDASTVIIRYAGNYTPVPGGVGPMTVASLLLNTLKAYKMNYLGI